MKWENFSRPFLNGHGPISIQTYPHHWCHCFDDTMSYNGHGTPGHQPETLRELYFPEI